jgi:hypothetical protein
LLKSYSVSLTMLDSRIQKWIHLEKNFQFGKKKIRLNRRIIHWSSFVLYLSFLFLYIFNGTVYIFGFIEKASWRFIGVWMQGFTLARQGLNHLSHTPPALFCFSCFSNRVNHFCLGMPGLWSSYLCLPHS